jgi:excisionase family DNA binding protein
MPLLTCEQIADQCQVNIETVRIWIRRGDLNAVNLAKKGQRPLYRIRQEAFDDFLARREVAPPPKSQRRRRGPHSSIYEDGMVEDII